MNEARQNKMLRVHIFVFLPVLGDRVQYLFIYKESRYLSPLHLTLYRIKFPSTPAVVRVFIMCVCLVLVNAFLLKHCEKSFSS